MPSRRMIAVLMLSALGVAARPAQGPELHRVMREKLDHMQAILEAVVTSDWKRLEAQSRDLERLTEDPRWMVLNYREYVRQSSVFKQKVADLHAASAQRDLEETPKAYVGVMLSCVECHRYLARSRIADVPVLPDAGFAPGLKP